MLRSDFPNLLFRQGVDPENRFNTGRRRFKGPMFYPATPIIPPMK
jgi:hypothetical protein